MAEQNIIINWLMTILLTSSLLVGFFFYLCFKYQVMAYFGRKALDWASLFYLFCMATLPGAMTLTFLDGPYIFGVKNEYFGLMVLIMCAASAKELMAWFASGIKTKKVLLDE